MSQIINFLSGVAIAAGKSYGIIEEEKKIPKVNKAKQKSKPSSMSSSSTANVRKSKIKHTQQISNLDTEDEVPVTFAEMIPYMEKHYKIDKEELYEIELAKQFIKSGEIDEEIFTENVESEYANDQPLITRAITRYKKDPVDAVRTYAPKLLYAD